MDLSEEVVIHTMAAGVKGCVHKNSSEYELAAAIHEVMKSKYHLTGRILSISQGISEVKKKQPSCTGCNFFTPRI